MPNWSYLAVHAAYHLGLTIWIGGAIVLGAIVAPGLFRSLPRSQAGAMFGPILRTFARLRIGAVVVTIAAAILQQVFWQRHAATVWIALRWLALGIMAVAVLYEIAWLEPRIAAAGALLSDGVPPEDERRVAFQRLHRRAEGSMKLSVGAALAALILS